MFRRILYIFPVLLLIVACQEKKEEQPTNSPGSRSEIQVTSEQFENGGMELGKLKEASFPRFIRTSGMIDVPPSNKAVISALEGGHVKDITLIVGDKVRKGERLITIENPEFVRIQQEFLEASEQMSFLENEFQRQKTLYEERVTSQKNYLKAEADFKRNLAVYNTLEKQLRMLNIDPVGVKAGQIASSVGIYAPISGSVTNISVNKGSYVSPTDEIMQLVNTEHVHLELEVFERDVMDVVEGLEIEFYFPERSATKYKGEVYLVGTQIDEMKRTTKVHGHFHKSDSLNFTVGMFIEAAIKTGEAKHLSLPESAIISIDDASFILKLIRMEDGNYIFTRVQVEVLETSDARSAIRSTDTLNDKDEYLIEGGYGLLFNN